MAQMIGRKIPVTTNETEQVAKALEKVNAVLVSVSELLLNLNPKMILQHLNCWWTKQQSAVFIRLLVT